MSVLSIHFQDDNDIHVLAGQTSPDLRQAGFLVVKRTNAAGNVESIWAIDDPAPDEQFSFKPLFKGTLNAGSFDGFGLKVNLQTGEVNAANPLPPIRKHNFILEAEADNTLLPANSPDRKKNTFIRIHVHQSITKVWLTPSVFTLHQHQTVAEMGFPQITDYKFAVHAQFDDNTVADITHWPGLTWTPAGHISVNSGFLLFQAFDAPGDTYQVTVTLPAALGGAVSDPVTVKVGDSWVGGPDNKVEIISGGGWPGTINPDVVPNVLFLGDGFGNTPADKTFFETYVGTLVHYMKQNPINRPYDVLATSINFWAGFLPSDKKGVTIRGEVYPVMDGAVKYAWYVPAPEKPPTDPAAKWTIENVIYTAGLPVLSHDGKNVGDIRTEWTQKLSPDPNAKIPEGLVKKWLKFAKRSLVDAVDTPLAVACGESTKSDINHNLISLDSNRMNRNIMDKYLNTLVSSSGINLKTIWTGKPVKSNNFDLICIIPAGVGRAQNEDGFFFVNPLGFNKIAIKDLPGTKAFQLDFTNIVLPSSADDERGRLLAHELSHSFFIGDEYWDSDEVSTMKAAQIDPEFSNLQASDDTLRAGNIHGDEIKWNWHRIYKAAVISADLADPAGDIWTVNLRTGQGNQFAAGDTVHFRFRQYPKALEKFPKIGIAMVVTEKNADSIKVKVKAPATDENYVTPLNYPAANLIQAAQFKDTFKAGSIIYIPKPAPQSVRDQVYCAEMIAPNVKKFITDNKRPLTDPNISYANSDEMQPNFDFSGVVSKPSLPDCFSRNRPRIVGIYEGGALMRKGIYHPTGHCIMRDSHTSGREFCAICRYILVDIIDPYKHWEIDRSYEKIYPQK